MAKVMVSIPDEVLARIDREVRRRGTTRSALLREAALRELGRPDPAVAAEAIERPQTSGSTPSSGTKRCAPRSMRSLLAL